MLTPDAVEGLDEALAADAEPGADVIEMVEIEVLSRVEGLLQSDESALTEDVPEEGSSLEDDE